MHRARPRRAAATTRLILSHHDLRGTPRDIAAVLDRLAATPADVIKAVFVSRDATDAVRVLGQLHALVPRRNVIALALGEAGLCTRVLARKLGGFLTFASLHAGAESAPGQPTIAELRDRYQWDKIGPATRVFGVIGWPVAHSLSPAVHNAALSATGIDAVYVPLPVRPTYRRLAAFLDELTAAPELAVTGLSVTLPHKENALRWLKDRHHSVTPTAERCGAVNTLTCRADGTWQGTNTDATGIQAALQTRPAQNTDRFGGQNVAVLGAGGVARAIVATLRDSGHAVTVYNRTAGRARRLARALHCAWQVWEQRTKYTDEILVNCTSVGMWPATDESPLPDEAVRPQTLVIDTIYRPVETRLLQTARRLGCATIGGMEMFIGQAVAQFEHWHSQSAPRDVMGQAAHDALVDRCEWGQTAPACTSPSPRQ